MSIPLIEIPVMSVISTFSFSPVILILFGVMWV